MKRFVAVTSSTTGTVHTLMTAEALEKVMASLERKMGGNTPSEDPEDTILSVEEIASADVVILAPDVRVERARFAKALIEAAAELGGMSAPLPSPLDFGAKPKKFVAVAVSAERIHHLFVTAISLRKAAKALGYEIRIEMQDPLGLTGNLTSKEIAEADAVVIAAEKEVDTSRFSGKPLYFTHTQHAAEAGQEVLARVFTQSKVESNGFRPNEKSHKTICGAARASYQHLLTGISYMLPMVTAGGLSMALAFTFSDIYSVEQKEGTLGWALTLIGSGIAFQFFVAMLSGYIAFSIADRAGLAPGFIGGMLAQHLGAGFLGGIASGFLAGYLTKILAESVRLPDTFKGLKSALILPFVSSLLVGLLMIYLVAPPIYIMLDTLTSWLCSLQGAPALLFGMLLGGMMAFDVGGPVNKAALTFAIGLLASKIYSPMAAVMIAGMTPPLGLATAAWLFKNRFDGEDRETATSTFLLGLSFFTEAAIPFALKEPFRVIPALIAGSATSGAISMTCQVELLVPHGGLFSILIPGAVRYLSLFFLALLAGILVTVVFLYILKNPAQREAVKPKY